MVMIDRPGLDWSDLEILTRFSHIPFPTTKFLVLIYQAQTFRFELVPFPSLELRKVEKLRKRFSLEYIVVVVRITDIMSDQLTLHSST